MDKTNVLIMIFTSTGEKKSQKFRLDFVSLYYVEVISDPGFWCVNKSRDK